MGFPSLRARDVSLDNQMIDIGTETNYGKVVAVGWVGERYYWCSDENGMISMIPEVVMLEEMRQYRRIRNDND